MSDGLTACADSPGDDPLLRTNTLFERPDTPSGALSQVLTPSAGNRVRGDRAGSPGRCTVLGPSTYLRAGRTVCLFSVMIKIHTDFTSLRLLSVFGLTHPKTYFCSAHHSSRNRMTAKVRAETVRLPNGESGSICPKPQEGGRARSSGAVIFSSGFGRI